MSSEPVTASAVAGAKVTGTVSCWPAVRATGHAVTGLPPTAGLPRLNGTGEAVEEGDTPVTSIARAAVTVAVMLLVAATLTDPKLTCPLTSGRAFETPKP